MFPTLRFLAGLATLALACAPARADFLPPLVAPEVKQAFLEARLGRLLRDRGLLLASGTIEVFESLNIARYLWKVPADLAGLLRGNLKSMDVEEVSFRASDSQGHSYGGSVGLVSSRGAYVMVPCEGMKAAGIAAGLNVACLPGGDGGEGILVVFLSNGTLNPYARPAHLRDLRLDLREAP